jgi:hypothetical protein
LQQRAAADSHINGCEGKRIPDLTRQSGFNGNATALQRPCFKTMGRMKLCDRRDGFLDMGRKNLRLVGHSLRRPFPVLVRPLKDRQFSPCRPISCHSAVNLSTSRPTMP